MAGLRFRDSLAQGRVVVVEMVLDGSLSLVDHTAEVMAQGAHLVLEVIDLALQGADIVELSQVGLDVTEELMELVVALLVLLLVARDGAVDAGELVVGVLESVMEVHELGLGGLEDIGILVKQILLKRIVALLGALRGVLGVLHRLWRWGCLGMALGSSDGLSVVRHDDELEDLKGVRGVRGSSRDTELVTGGNAELVRLEAEHAIDVDTELVPALVNLDL